MDDSTGLIRLNSRAHKDQSPEEDINIENLLENVMSQMLDETTNTQMDNTASKECNYVFDTNIFQDDSEFVKIFSSIYNTKADIECTVDEIVHSANGDQKMMRLAKKMQDYLKELKAAIVTCVNEMDDQRKEMFRVAQALIRCQNNQNDL